MEGIDITPFKNDPALADADEDCGPEAREAALRRNALKIERLAEEILRVASRPRRGLI
jgi:hypothetical protein